MAMGKRKGEQQQLLFVPAEQAFGPANPFYDRLNGLLHKYDFDSKVEDLCSPHFKKGGRPSVPPGCFFRLLMVGYFEGIHSDRGIAWKAADSKSIERFVGMPDGKPTPHHDTLSATRKMYGEEVFETVFSIVLEVSQKEGLVKAKQVGIDASTVEANAAMRSIELKMTKERWNDHIKRLAEEERLEEAQREAEEKGEEPPDGPPPPKHGMSKLEDARRRDRARSKRGDKKVSNKDWESRTDPDARIARMKDGTTHMAYKVENAVDLETETILAAGVHHADQGDTFTGLKTFLAAHDEVVALENGPEGIDEIVLDTGYHSGSSLSVFEELGVRTYIPEKPKDAATPIRRGSTRHEHRRPILNNRRRTRREKGRKLQRLRSEKVERTFANLLDNGGQRRMTHRGIEAIRKRYKMAAAAFNLGVILRSLLGVGTPKGFSDRRKSLAGDVSSLFETLSAAIQHACRPIREILMISFRFWCDTRSKSRFLFPLLHQASVAA